MYVSFGSTLVTRLNYQEDLETSLNLHFLYESWTTETQFRSFVILKTGVLSQLITKNANQYRQ